MTSAPDSTSPGDTGRSAALLMAAQGVVLVVLAGILVADVVRGEAADTTQALTESGFVAIFALGAGALAWGLRAGSGWARTPSLLWNLLLLPVAFSMFGAGQAVLGTVVLVVAVLTLAMVWRAPGVELPDD